MLTVSPPDMIKICFVTNLKLAAAVESAFITLLTLFQSLLWLALLRNSVSFYFPPHLLMLRQRQKKKPRAELLKNLAEAIVPKQRLVQARSHWTNSFFFLPSQMCFIFVLLWLWLLGNCMSPWRLKKNKKIWLKIHVFVWVFCLVPACLSMYNCEQFCPGQLAWQI